MEAKNEIRPKLKQDSIFLPTGEGVLLRNGDNVFFMKGKTVYRWVSALAPHLTGEQTIEDLCASLEPERRRMVTQLVETLLEKGILKNHIPEDSVTLPEEVRARFQPQIEFIDHFTERPLSKFKAFRQSRVLLIGSGISFSALAGSLLRNGLEEVYMAPIEGSDDVRRELDQEVAALRQDGVKAAVSVVSSGEVSSVCRLLGDFQTIAYCCDRPSLKDIYLLNSQCFREERAFLPGTIFGGQSFIGPLVKPGLQGCWFCSILRLSSNIGERRRASLWRGLALGGDEFYEEAACFLPTARMLGNNLAFELFKFLTQQLRPESQGAILIQELDTLESSRSQLWPHPLCSVCSRVSPDNESQRLDEIVRGEHDKDLTVDEQLLPWYRRTDPLLGILKGFPDEELVQIPLRATLLELGHPLDPSAPEIRVASYSEETTIKARQLALLEALKRYSQALPDRRAMLEGSFDDLSGAALDPVSHRELSLWSGGPGFEKDSRIAWLPAHSLLTWRVRYVPAAAVYNSSSLNNLRVFDRASAGTGVGLTFEDARLDGLLSALSDERLRDIARGTGATASLDPELLSSLDSDLAFLIKSVQRLNRSLRIAELMGEPPVRVVLATAADDDGTAPRYIPHVGSGLSQVEAAKRALLQLVGALQSQPPRVEAGDTAQLLSTSFLLPPNTVIPPAEKNLYEQRQTTTRDVDDYLKRRERDALFVNTTTADIWETNTYITGKVLLTREKSD